MRFASILVILVQGSLVHGGNVATAKGDVLQVKCETVAAPSSFDRRSCFFIVTASLKSADEVAAICSKFMNGAHVAAASDLSNTAKTRLNYNDKTKYFSGEPGDNLGLICRTKSQSICREGEVYNDGKCYLSTGKKETWSEGAQRCCSLDSDLPVVENSETAAIVLGLAEGPAWIRQLSNGFSRNNPEVQAGIGFINPKAAIAGKVFPFLNADASDTNCSGKGTWNVADKNEKKTTVCVREASSAYTPALKVERNCTGEVDCPMGCCKAGVWPFGSAVSPRVKPVTHMRVPIEWGLQPGHRYIVEAIYNDPALPNWSLNFFDRNFNTFLYHFNPSPSQKCLNIGYNGPHHWASTNGCSKEQYRLPFNKTTTIEFVRTGKGLDAYTDGVLVNSFPDLSNLNRTKYITNVAVTILSVMPSNISQYDEGNAVYIPTVNGKVGTYSSKLFQPPQWLEIPYKGFKLGDKIRIKGTPINAHEFGVDIRSAGAIPFHVNPRLYKNHIVLNTHYGAWGVEEFAKNPFKPGKRFVMQLVRHLKATELIVDGNSLYNYTNRMNMDAAETLVIGGIDTHGVDFSLADEK